MIDSLERAQGPLFSSLLKIHYDKRFIPTAQKYVETLADLAGATPKESSELVLLVEECLVFIIEKYLDGRDESHIEICFSLEPENVVRIEMVDVGPPVDESKIPKFDFNDKTSEAGLWLHLVKSFSDEFSFVNRAKRGWLLRTSKKLKSVSFEPAGLLAAESDESGDGKACGKFIPRKATPEDAPLLVELAYMTYRYSYAASYYDADWLGKFIASGQGEYLVVECEGRLVGAFAFKFFGDRLQYVEVGSAMIHPEFRTGSAVRRLFVMMSKYVKENPRDCDFFMSDAVTTHARSQRLLHKVADGFRPMSLFLGMVPPASYIGINEDAAERESTVYMYQFKKPFGVDRIFVPALHREIVTELLENANLSLEVDAGTDGFVPAEETTFELTDWGICAFVNFTALGLDWVSNVARTVLSLLASGVEGINVNISATGPLPADLDQRLGELNLVFSGVSLQSLDQVSLSYCFAIRPFNYSRIHLADPVAQKLLDHMQKCYPEKIIGASEPGEAAQ